MKVWLVSCISIFCLKFCLLFFHFDLFDVYGYHALSAGFAIAMLSAPPQPLTLKSPYSVKYLAIQA